MGLFDDNTKDILDGLREPTWKTSKPVEPAPVALPLKGLPDRKDKLAMNIMANGEPVATQLFASYLAGQHDQRDADKLIVDKLEAEIATLKAQLPTKEEVLKVIPLLQNEYEGTHQWNELQPFIAKLTAIISGAKK